MSAIASAGGAMTEDVVSAVRTRLRTASSLMRDALGNANPTGADVLAVAALLERERGAQNVHADLSRMEEELATARSAAGEAIADLSDVERDRIALADKLERAQVALADVYCIFPEVRATAAFHALTEALQ